VAEMQDLKALNRRRRNQKIDTLPNGPYACDSATSPALMMMRGIRKVYPGGVALSSVDLDIYSGEVHGLVGENGAGKSTLLKIACGALAPTDGQLILDGTPRSFADPREAQDAGIAAIHQELTIIPGLTAMANVFLGREKHRVGFIADRFMADDFRALADQLEANIEPDVRAGSLSIADQQSLEIMRGLAARARILILDEPTASIGALEREALYETVRRLRSQGVALVLISHDMDEVFALSDRITVLRGGTLVDTRIRANWTRQMVVNAMLGEEPRRKLPIHTLPRPIQAQTALEVTDVRVPGKLHVAGLHVKRGEILGLAGLVGSGRTEFLRALAGMELGSSGQLRIGGVPWKWPATPRDAIRAGIALAPEDRKRQGLVLGLPSYANVTLTNPWKVSRCGLLFQRDELHSAERSTKRVGLQAGALERSTKNLSGGNQQKLVLAKWLGSTVRVLLVDEPTRGVDIGAKAELFAALKDFASTGVAIILVSSELEEVSDHSDRIVVISRGMILGELTGDGRTKANILNVIFAAPTDAVQ
jgi:ABC-type sugar transport system ATPase subunit